MAIDLIYCARGNHQLADIAVREGWLYGSQPGTVYHPVSFTDLDYKKGLCPKYLRKYADFVKRHRPKYATVPDLIRADEVDFILRYAETDIAPHCQNIIAIPKICGVIPDIPLEIGQTPVILGYSVPTRYGATSVPDWEFRGRSVHLLGGSPKKQFAVWRYLDKIVSVDGNTMNKMATTICAHWDSKKWGFVTRPNQTMTESFETSCVEIMKEWRRLEHENRT